jgi:hypothetical protein
VELSRFVSSAASRVPFGLQLLLAEKPLRFGPGKISFSAQLRPIGTRARYLPLVWDILFAVTEFLGTGS